MFQPELTMDSIFDQIEHHDFNMDALVDFCDFDQFPTLFTTTEDNSELPSLQFSPPRFPSDDFVTTTEESEFSSIPCPIYDVSQQIVLNDEIESMYGGLEDIFPTEVGILFPGQDPYFNGGIFPLQPLPSEGEGSFSPSQSMNSESVLTDVESVQSSLTLLGEDKEIENQLGLLHLLKAYGEALEKDQRELGQVITYFETHHEIIQGENLKQESLKNFKAAFRALYQALPDGKFAHFAANSAIPEAIPDDAETIHIVDFNMGEGVQWPPMFEAIAHQHKTLKLTSMRWKEEDCNGAALWRFKETKRQLYDQARAFGLKLKVEEMGIDDLVSELKKKRGGRREEARIALECLFMAPYISSLAWFQRWKEIRGGCHLEAGLGLVGRRLSKEIFMEAREMVEEGENKYGIRIEGQIGNEMVLEWKRNTIVRVSTWANHS
ncbi:hypothetical protein SO802_031140 [Lithocarpus litseifolius]|uniref:Nodulation-signaling pathway 2 protein-like n=1 Tax=Lithocarpus litseifolius TaxID=425828 RepID=A0AAW2BMR8_9ROSI